MTEAEWLVCGDPFHMLCHLQEGGTLGACWGSRKARLFAVACCRRVLAFLPDDRHREAVELSARFADGQASASDLEELSESLWAFYGVPPGAGYLIQPAEMCYLLSYWPLAADWMDACTGAEQAVMLVGHVHRTGQVLRSDVWFANDKWWESEAEAARTAERFAQASVIRDIFGNPFRPSSSLSPAVLAWNDGTVRRIAEGIYQDRQMPEGTLDNSRLLILADALLDAGCEDEALMEHCRSEGPHVRGCWAIDTILGKG